MGLVAFVRRCLKYGRQRIIKRFIENSFLIVSFAFSSSSSLVDACSHFLRSSSQDRPLPILQVIIAEARAVHVLQEYINPGTVR